MAKFWKLKYHKDTTEKRPITNEDIAFLQHLQTELNTQDTVGQADPRYWVIRDYKKVYGENLACPDGYELVDENAGESVYTSDTTSLETDEEKATLLKELEETNLLSDELKNAIQHAYYIWDIQDELQNIDIQIQEYELQPVSSGMFLTHEAAQKHLKENQYHYSDIAHTYAETAWRTIEEPLWNILQTIDWSKIKTDNTESKQKEQTI